MPVTLDRWSDKTPADERMDVTTKEYRVLMRGGTIKRGDDEISMDDGPFKIVAPDQIVERGGAGSGHHGHRGRPGEVGGSLPGKGGRGAPRGAMTEGEAPDLQDIQPPAMGGRAPTSYAEYIDKYDALPTKDDLADWKSDRNYKIRVHDNALRIALAELENMTPEEILALNRQDFNLWNAPFIEQLSADRDRLIEAEGDVEIAGLEGMSYEEKKLFLDSYIFAVESGYDSALEFWHRRLIARGDVSPDDDRLSHVTRQPQGREWTTMPETLYHVTTAADAIKNTGIKSRFELFLSSTKGLGGGESDTISFSADFDVARDIDRALHEGSAAARGDFTMEMMLDWASRGLDAPGPYISRVYALSVNSSIGDEERAKMDQRAAEEPGWIPEELLRQVRVDNEKDKPWHDFEFYQRIFANARQLGGGPTYPLFWGVDKQALADADPSQFSIMQFTPSEGSMGYQMGGLGEWRTVGGENVQLVDQHETLTAEEEEAYFGR